MKLSELRGKTVVVDMDGILCDESKTFERIFTNPIQKNIDIVNRLYYIGATIIIHTARGWGELKITLQQLRDWNVLYHTVICGKPIADIVIDDRAINSFEGFEDV